MTATAPVVRHRRSRRGMRVARRVQLLQCRRTSRQGGAATWYQPGRRGWAKVKHCDNEVIVGAVIRRIDRPEVVVGGGLPRKRPGDSRPYRPAEPRPGSRAGGSFETSRCPASLARRGRRRPLGSPRPKGSVVKVRPVLVDEVAADPRRARRPLPPSSAVPSFTGGPTSASVDALIPLTGVPLGQRRARGRRGAVSSPVRRSLFGA